MPFVKTDYLPNNFHCGKDFELYNCLNNNDLDRGHLVRRLDPCWGSAATARQANRDSNFFTNIGPQHKNLNQKLWLDLEDHILSNTDDENARVSVFVGCVPYERIIPRFAAFRKKAIGPQARRQAASSRDDCSRTTWSKASANAGGAERM